LVYQQQNVIHSGKTNIEMLESCKFLGMISLGRWGLEMFDVEAYFSLLGMLMNMIETPSRSPENEMLQIYHQRR